MLEHLQRGGTSLARAVHRGSVVGSVVGSAGVVVRLGGGGACGGTCVRATRRHISAGSTLLRAAATTFDTLESKSSYCLGANIGRQLGDLKILSPDEIDCVIAGIKDTLTGAPLQVDVEEFGPKAVEFIKAKCVYIQPLAVPSARLMMHSWPMAGKLKSRRRPTRSRCASLPQQQPQRRSSPLMRCRSLVLCEMMRGGRGKLWAAAGEAAITHPCVREAGLTPRAA
jgi:hypothetical protein